MFFYILMGSKIKILNKKEVKMKFPDELYDEIDYCQICGGIFQIVDLAEVENHSEFIGDEESKLVCFECN